LCHFVAQIILRSNASGAIQNIKAVTHYTQGTDI